MKDLVFISCQPNERLFAWQVDVQLANFRKYGYSKNAHVLVLDHDKRIGNFDEDWKKLETKYPEVQFFHYLDDGIHNLMMAFNYIPLLRPWLLQKHFTRFPELSQKVIFYHDSDVVFTKYLDFTPFLDDDICYLSNTKSYIAASYFDSKIKDVLPDKLERYKQIDVLSDCLKIFDLTRDDAVKNEDSSGGAQYLLKNIDKTFWADVMIGCMSIRVHLNNINRAYFENENKGFQVWCADMWSILWNLWTKKIVTQCPEEMDFAWATDLVEKWDNVYLYHDAGASTRLVEEGHRLFNKRDMKYINNISTPFEEDLSYVSKKYCSSKYVQEIEQAKNITI